MRKYKFEKRLQEPVLSEKDSRQICKQLLVENAVWHLINNHQMDEMIGDSHNLRRQTDMINRGFDFESEELCIEMKVFLQKLNAGYGGLMKRFRHSIKQMIGYSSCFSEMGIDGKRIILLVVGQRGINKGIRALIEKGNDRLLKKAADMGMELWVAEVELESGADMELLSYENMTNDMRGGLNIG